MFNSNTLFQIKNIKLQIKNIEAQLDNLNFQMKNTELSNIGMQINNMSIQMFNMGIQFLNIGKEISIDNPSINVNMNINLQNIVKQINDFIFPLMNMSEIVMNPMGIPPYISSMSMNNQMYNNFNSNLEEWNLIFQKKSGGQPIVINISPEKTIKEAINMFKLKINEKRNIMKFVFNGKELIPEMKICESELNDVSKILVIDY